MCIYFYNVIWSGRYYCTMVFFFFFTDNGAIKIAHFEMCFAVWMLKIVLLSVSSIITRNCAVEMAQYRNIFFLSKFSWSFRNFSIINLSKMTLANDSEHCFPPIQTDDINLCSISCVNRCRKQLLYWPKALETRCFLLPHQLVNQANNFE